LNAKELLANILGSNQIKTETVICKEAFARFQAQYDYIIPGHIFYETDDKAISQAVSDFGGCCRLDPKGNIHIFSLEQKPNRTNFNQLLPEIVAQTLPSFADSFAMNLSKQVAAT